MVVSLSSNLFYFSLWAAAGALLLEGSVRGFKEIRASGNCLPMSIPFTESMKGLMAVIILLGHYALRLEGLGPLRVVLRSVGLPGVTVFLFISGYCETIQFMKRKEAYFEGFIFKKIIRICTPWVVSSIVVAVLFRITDIGILLKGFLGFHVLYRDNTPNWFVMYILYCYLTLFIYHLQAKLRGKAQVPNKLYFAFLAVSALVWFCVCIEKGLENNWYTNSFTFLIGSFAAVYKDRLMTLTWKKSVYQVAFLAAAVGVLMVIPALVRNNIFLVNSIRLLNTVVVSAFVWQLSVVFNSNSEVLRFLGKQSLEIFLIGSPIFWFYYSRFPQTGISVLWVFGLGILGAYLVRRLGSVIIKGLNTLLVKNNEHNCGRSF